ncbi:MAG TPA: pirin family protein [Enhygromyxa sp.]|nr:pirin family protein [Enhygromyxa sp.]
MRRRELLGGTLMLGAAACVDPPTLAGARTGAHTRPADAARVVQKITALPAIDGAGATVQRLFPSPELRHLDPFVLLDDFDVRRPAGFPDHPHRGFEAFTYMIEGAFHHRDSMGNDSIIGPGGTQRFTSGRGARHSEMPASDGRNRGLQLWVNLPGRLKRIEPSYVGIAGERMPVASLGDRVIREVVGASSPVVLQTEVDYLDVELLADARFERAVPDGHNALIYLLDGELELLGERLRGGEALLPTAGNVVIRARANSRMLWLSGRPHGEPIRHRGPFVD